MNIANLYNHTITERISRILINVLLVSILLLVSTKLVFAGSFNDSAVGHEAFPLWFNNSPFQELDEDLSNARAKGKQGLMVLYSTEGCSYCKQFIKKSLGDPEIASALQKNFDSIGLEIFDDAELSSPSGITTSIKRFAESEGVQFAPTILFYGEGGKRLLRVTGYQSPARFKKILGYVGGKHYRTQTLAEYLKRSERPNATVQSVARLKQDPLFGKAPHRLQRNVIPASQPLLVIFEKPGCAECTDFHSAVLASNDVRSSLEKFEVVRLNALDNKSMVVLPDGSRISPASWFNQAGFSRLPALVFYSEKGHEALKTDTLIMRNRMMNSINYVLERAYIKGWSYQRFARSKAIERNMKKKMAKTK